ncbi:MAG TPA: hypothetical protein QF409_02865 [Acidimicrobiales bacterium]|jgi:hypothetical protein|nr:hypothetical protein [Acidimicrobiales bacterium]
MSNDGVFNNSQGAVSDTDGAVLIDCDLCELSGSDVCDDCLVTYLCGSRSGSVVIELSEVRTLRPIERADFVSGLKLRKPAGLESGR